MVLLQAQQLAGSRSGSLLAGRAPSLQPHVRGTGVSSLPVCRHAWHRRPQETFCLGRSVRWCWLGKGAPPLSEGVMLGWFFGSCGGHQLSPTPTAKMSHPSLSPSCPVCPCPVRLSCPKHHTEIYDDMTWRYMLLNHASRLLVGGCLLYAVIMLLLFKRRPTATPARVILPEPVACGFFSCYCRWSLWVYSRCRRREMPNRWELFNGGYSTLV